eukprot:TRINITY_DN6447_c0_g1_i13.p1 TRINITY_DN6447_c0_g1~~TRINITY_DN6447_c0_g1_i13.p1  ORF type:complete len:502 (+),score=86.51 TRINITY_DN6447_c0_g1_i13:73-1578(+)
MCIRDRWENINPLDHCVVQRYIHKPYLIDGLKFDLRVYVLVYGCDPLRVYIFKEGLARLATQPYVPPKCSNLASAFMHLTNYAINKNSENFVFNSDAERTDIGHKRSLTFVWKYVAENGGDANALQEEIRAAIVKTLCAVQPLLADSYKGCQPLDHRNDKCFEILGFDILIDESLKPWLLEVNHSPSFSVDTPFDAKVKAELLSDTVKILHLDPMKRINFYKKREIASQNRCLGKCKESFKKLTKDERLEHKKRHMAKRDKHELEHCGGYTRIYPDLRSPCKYSNFIEAATKMWQEFFSAKSRKAHSPVKPVSKQAAYKESRPQKIFIPSRINKTMEQYKRARTNAKSIESVNSTVINNQTSSLSLPPISRALEKHNNREQIDTLEMPLSYSPPIVRAQNQDLTPHSIKRSVKSTADKRAEIPLQSRKPKASLNFSYYNKTILNFNNFIVSGSSVEIPLAYQDFCRHTIFKKADGKEYGAVVGFVPREGFVARPIRAKGRG